MSADVLALVVRVERDYPGGEFVDHDVVDSRTGEVIATRSELESANDVAIFLNSMYPIASQAPAHDTLVHEVICWRIGETQCLEGWWLMIGRTSSCPTHVPIGPGWDHLYPEHDQGDWEWRSA